MVDAERLARLLRRFTDDVARLDAVRTRGEELRVHRYGDVDDTLVVRQLDQLPALHAFVRSLTTTYL